MYRLTCKTDPIDFTVLARAAYSVLGRTTSIYIRYVLDCLSKTRSSREDGGMHLEHYAISRDDKSTQLPRKDGHMKMAGCTLRILRGHVKWGILNFSTST